MHLTLATGARQLIAMKRQAHRSGGAAHCQEFARGCLTLTFSGAACGTGETMRNSLRGLRCNVLFGGLILVSSSLFLFSTTPLAFVFPLAFSLALSSG